MIIRQKGFDPLSVARYEVARCLVDQLGRSVDVTGSDLDVAVLDSPPGALRPNEATTEGPVNDVRIAQRCKRSLDV